MRHFDKKNIGPKIHARVHINDKNEDLDEKTDNLRQSLGLTNLKSSKVNQKDYESIQEDKTLSNTTVHEEKCIDGNQNSLNYGKRTRSQDCKPRISKVSKLDSDVENEPLSTPKVTRSRSVQTKKSKTIVPSPNLQECKLCSKTFNSQDSLRKHFIATHQIIYPKLCNCLQSIESAEDMKVHLKMECTSVRRKNVLAPKLPPSKVNNAELDESSNSSDSEFHGFLSDIEDNFDLDQQKASAHITRAKINEMVEKSRDTITEFVQEKTLDQAPTSPTRFSDIPPLSAQNTRSQINKKEENSRDIQEEIVIEITDCGQNQDIFQGWGPTYPSEFSDVPPLPAKDTNTRVKINEMDEKSRDTLEENLEKEIDQKKNQDQEVLPTLLIATPKVTKRGSLQQKKSKKNVPRNKCETNNNQKKLSIQKEEKPKNDANFDHVINNDKIPVDKEQQQNKTNKLKKNVNIKEHDEPNGNAKSDVQSISDFEKPYGCVSCSQAFELPEYLSHHVKIEHLQKEQPQNSAVGTVGEIAPKTLIKNRAGGTKKKEKQHSCEQCDKTFTDRKNMKKHIKRIHEGLNLYVCNECNQGYSQKAHMQRHINSVHKNIKEYGCKKCPARYVRKEDLTRHEKKCE